MGMFSSLGDVVNVPKLQTAVQGAVGEVVSEVGGIVNGVVNGAASGISNFVSTNFNLPSLSKLTGELASKLGLSGQLGAFKSLNVAGDVAAMIPGAQERAPAGMVPGNPEDFTQEFKVTISQEPSIPESLNVLTFTVMPRISESGAAEYDQLTPLHHPGAIMKYKYSNARSWSVSGRLISRNVQEATMNLEALNMIRGWRMPFYGEGTAADPYTSQYLGAPPPILTLEAYGRLMIGPVKCVMTSYNWDFPNDVDYIMTVFGNPFPVIIDININLTETWSPAEFSGFDLYKYKTGQLHNGAFSRVTNGSNQPTMPAAIGAIDVDGMLKSEPVFQGRSTGKGGPTAAELAEYDKELKKKADTMKSDFKAAMGDVKSGLGL